MSRVDEINSPEVDSIPPPPLLIIPNRGSEAGSSGHRTPSESTSVLNRDVTSRLTSGIFKKMKLAMDIPHARVCPVQNLERADWSLPGVVFNEYFLRLGV